MSLPLTIFKGSARVCDTLYCNSMTAVYHVGRDDARHFVNGYFCEDCIKHLVNTIPAELVEGGEELEQKLRHKITKEYDKKLGELENAIRKNAAIEAAAVIAQAVQPEPVKVEEPAKETPADKPEVIEIEYRCLDCGETFDTKRKLMTHIKIHAAG